MKMFLLNVLGFGIFLGIISIIIFRYIPDYGRQNNVLYILKDKYDVIGKMPSPKIILVGGSNLAFGLNTEAIAKSLNLPVYNMGVHAGLGLQFMLNSLEPYINKEDIVVVVPEYTQFSTGLYGADELLTVLADVVPEKYNHLSYAQMWSLWSVVPKTIGRKAFHGVLKTVLPSKYKDDKHIAPVYHKTAFNEYGDATKHWALKTVTLEGTKLTGEFKPAAFVCLDNFVKKIETKGAKVLIGYPCFQQTSFEKSLDFINRLDSTLQQMNLQIISKPERYKMADSLCFDTFYHLTKEGVDIRTQRLIEDLKNAI